MLLKQNRLKKKKDFEKVFNQGKIYRHDFLFLKILSNDLEFSRIGFIVSKKISKKAVVRNKVKRRLRNIVRKKIVEMKKNNDMIIIALAGIEKKTFKEIESGITEIFIKTEII
ncbi:MAG: ribonuclease P protein component [Patescibacteria group bacterium]|nr:ribonuclease P protein component [Patescibacteria group bacterium]